MKKIKNIIPGCLLLVSSIISAQSITWGKENTSSVPIRGILGYDDQGFYVLRYTRDTSPYGERQMKDVTIEKYDYSDNQVYTKAIEIPEVEGKKKNLLIDAVLYLKDNMIAIAYGNDSKDAYAVKINKDGTIDANKTLLGSVDPSSIVSQNNLLASNRYSISVSKDKSMLMAYYVKAKQKKVSIKMLGENLDEKWSKEVEPPFAGDFNYVEALTDGAKVYFLVNEEKEKHKSVYSLMRYDNGTNNIEKIELKLNNDKPISAFNVDISSSGDLWVTGFYEDKEGDGTRGCFVIDVDNNSGQVKLNKCADLSDDFLAKFVSAKKVSNGKGIEDVNMRDAIVMPDGGILLLAEQYKGTAFYRVPNTAARANMSDPNPAHRQFAMADVEATNRYKDGIIIKLNSDGAIVWTSDIIKDANHNTTSIAKLVSPYGYFFSGNTLCLVYNEYVKYASESQEDLSKNKDDVKMMWLDANPSDWALSLATIDIASGATQKKQVKSEYHKSDEIIYTGLLTQANNNIIMYRAEGKKSQCGQFIMQ